MNDIPATPPPLPHVTSHTRPKKSIFLWMLAAIGVFCILIALLSFSAIYSLSRSTLDSINQANSSLTESPNLTHETLIHGNHNRIAHIDLEGVISASTGRNESNSMVEDFQNILQTAVNDHTVKAIVIRINSPGGEATASDRLHRMIQIADKSKPVISYLDTIAASGGYYAACGTRHIIAHPTTFTGSIGVIMQSIKYSDLLNKVGVSMDTYKSGALKDLLSGSRASTPEEQALLNNLIQENYTRFLTVVSESRNKSIQDLRASPLTDGRIFSGAQGLAAGMVDANGFIEDAYQTAMALSNSPNSTVIRYSKKRSLFETLSQFATANASAPRLEVDVSDRLLPRIQNGVPLYLHLGGF